jgi:predicted ATPase
VIESPFATVQLRTTVVQRFKKIENAMALIWKILQGAESTFRRLKGAELERPHWCALLAEAYGKVGQIEEGLTVLAEALAAVDENGDRYYEAELYRLKGELTLQQENQKSKDKSQITPSTREAEACFHKAIEIAQKQQAKSWELRATMSLARLWQQQGKQKEAHDLLAEIYNWFTEDFDTKDLQEAKTLLEELT